MKAVWFISGWVVGLMMVSLSMGAVPRDQKMIITDDTALYQKISEIRVGKEPAPNFDSDLKRLSNLQGRYQESPLLSSPLKRISMQKYQKSSVKRSKKTASAPAGGY